MKIKKLSSTIISLSIALSLGFGVATFHSVTHKEVSAYEVSDLPTTIDLNDCSESQIRNYYSSLNSKSTAERQGTNLLKNLKTILSNGQKYYAYNDDKRIWKMYEITDRDWDKSPASSTTYGSYNPTTNKITGYQYGTGASNSKNNPYIHALYINRNLNNQTRAWDDHNQDAWGINREHIWAKSHGFDDDENSLGGARGDPMHLWAGNGWANNVHSNYFFGFVDKTKSYTDSGTKYGTAWNNIRGISKNANSSGTVFEPQDCDKGDIARAIFYMAARYNNYAGASSGFDADNPNLVLANSLSENSRTGTSSYNSPYAMGLLSDLLAWNKLDPVDEYEVHRNNLLYKNYTNNRNPFIDFPNWADAIWGTADSDGKNYNSSITTYATPASDPIGSEANSEFSISTNSLDLEVGQTATIRGSNADSSITWTVGDNSVVSINKTTTSNNESLTVTALSAGSTTITATSSNGSLVCNVTVTEQTLEISLNRNTASVEVGQTTTLTATVTPNNAQVTVTWSSSDEDVATVLNGVVTGVAAGTVVITAQISDSVKAECTITVTNNGGSQEEQNVIFTADLTDTATVDNGFDISFDNVSKKTGFYQDGGSAGDSVYFAVLGTSPLFDSEPNSITFSARLGSGNNVDNLVNNVEACLIDEDGNEILSTKRTLITSVITTPGEYTVELPYSSNAYGAKISHIKVSGYNIRYYSFSLSYEDGIPTDIEVEDYLNVVSSTELLAAESTSSGPVNEGTTFSARMVDKEELSDFAMGEVVLNGAQGTHANAVPTYYTNGTALRLYAGNTLTFTAPGNITRINFTFTSSDDTSALSSDDATYSSELGAWDCSSETVVFNVTAKSRISSVRVTYEGGATTTVTSAGLRFSASIAKSTWAAIEENWDISEYGFMLFKTDSLDGLSETPVKDRYENSGALAVARSASGAAPTYEEGDNYVFSVKVNVSTYSKYFCAAAYFVIDDVYYFLTEQQKTVKGMAEYHIANGGTTISSAALAILAA